MPPVRRNGPVARVYVAARRTPSGARPRGEPTNSSPGAGGAAQLSPVQPPTPVQEPMLVDNDGNQQDSVITKKDLQDFMTTTLNCHIAHACQGHLGTEEPALMCPGCSKLYCGGCYGRKQKCPSCGLVVRKKGLIKCLWVGDVIAVLNEVISLEWTADEPGEEATEALKKLSRAIECPICMDTIVDARCCRRCSKPFCKHCLVRGLRDPQMQECPCCIAPMATVDDAIRCTWLQTLGEMIDSLLKKPTRVLPVDPTPMSTASINDQPPTELDTAVDDVVYAISDAVAETVARVVHDVVRRSIRFHLNGYRSRGDGGSGGRGGRPHPY